MFSSSIQPQSYTRNFRTACQDTSDRVKLAHTNLKKLFNIRNVQRLFYKDHGFLSWCCHLELPRCLVANSGFVNKVQYQLSEIHVTYYYTDPYICLSFFFFSFMVGIQPVGCITPLIVLLMSNTLSNVSEVYLCILACLATFFSRRDHSNIFSCVSISILDIFVSTTCLLRFSHELFLTFSSLWGAYFVSFSLYPV